MPRTGRPPEHGMSHTPEHRAYQHMMDRCYKPYVDRYPRYGGRGIIVCPRWRKSFQAFLEDMGPCPKGLTLERNDTNGHYTPGNCRWASRKEQANNTARNQNVTWNGRTQTIAQWAEELDLKYACLYRRIVVLGETFPEAGRPLYARK